MSKACRAGGPLESAVRGTRIDPADPAFVVWITEPQRGPDSVSDATPQPVAGPTKGEMLELSRRKRAAEAEKLELANAQTRGGLISRELVKTHIFGGQEFLAKRLLGDAAKSIASKVFNLVRAKGTLEEAQRVVREEISKQLRATKDKQLRLLLRPGESRPKPRATARRKRARKATKK